MKNRFRPIAILAIAGGVSACADPSSPTVPSAPDAVSLHPLASRMSAPIAGDYIVTFEEGEDDPRGRAVALVAARNGKLKHAFTHGMKGFAATLSDDAAAELANTPGVLRVEADITMHASTTVTPTSWGLDRLDQRPLPLDNSYTFASVGAGVRVYIVDTGILTTHQEFGTRATGGFTAFSDGRGSTDCHGHGTHVAGTAGGSSSGIARGAQLIAVRVLDCNGSGTTSGVIAGIDWVTGEKKRLGGPMVANLSLGGGYSASLNDAVSRSVQAGVVFAVAAGNDGADACTQSPASAASALTVGATDRYDVRASYSNYGRCLDIFAPGSGIHSSWITGTDAYASISGTSMASPHVAGVAALILGDNPSYTPSQVQSVLTSSGTSNALSSIGSESPNRLLSNLYASAPPPPSTTPFTLSVRTSRTGKSYSANLSWTGGVAGQNVEIFRNGNRLVTTANDGAHTDSRLSSGSYGYKVCQGTNCSATVTVTF